MGATFISVPFPEIYVALQQGLADAVFWLDAGFIPYRLYEVAKYHTTVGMTGGGIHHCYNTAWFDGLPADLQDAFLRLQEPMAMSIAKVTGVDFPQKARETYLANGVEMLTLSDEELARWKANVAPVFEAWVAKVEADGKPIRAMLAKIDALKAEYGALSPDELMRLAVEAPVLPPR
jgi:TRAP-type C4-dicarboxylate transport system substrate-binding protein